jgi:hypothetical protein
MIIQHDQKKELRMALYRCIWAVLFGLFALAPDVRAAVECPPGFQPRAEVCVSQRMIDFIACVQEVGGNKQEVDDFFSETLKGKIKGGAAGQGNGLIVSGKGSLELDKDSEQEIAKRLQTKFFPTGLEQCRMVVSVEPQEPNKRIKLGFIRNREVTAIKGECASHNPDCVRYSELLVLYKNRQVFVSSCGSSGGDPVACGDRCDFGDAFCKSAGHSHYTCTKRYTLPAEAYGLFDPGDEHDHCVNSATCGVVQEVECRD